MWLPYQIAFELVVALAICVLVLSRFQSPSTRVPLATAKELTIVMALYGTWQYIRDKAVTKTAGAMENGRSLWNFEQRIHLPSEAALEKLFINNRPTMVFFDLYYGGVHVPAAAILLVWLFFRHRDKYAAIRWIFALTIAGCLVIQALVPLAPPRFFPDLGFVDAGLKYGLSVYGQSGHGVSNEVAAMPSFHVAWAVLVGLAVVLISSSRWRWLALAHPVLTILAVTITANHWWLDGVVGVMVLGVAFVVQRCLAALFGWARTRYVREPVTVQ
jgi:PAP2 superfamily